MNLRRLRDDGGMSLIELMVASVLFMVLLGAALQMLDSGTRSERAQQSRHSALVELRGAVGRITKELRQATSVSPASTTTRLDMTTLISGQPHAVVYEVTGGAMYRSMDGGPATEIASNVTTAPSFCYDPPDCVAVGAAGPSMVRVTLALEPDVFSGGPITLATDIQLRNS